MKWKSRKEISLCEVETVEAQERLETVERERSRGLMRNILVNIFRGQGADEEYIVNISGIYCIYTEKSM